MRFPFPRIVVASVIVMCAGPFSNGAPPQEQQKTAQGARIEGMHSRMMMAMKVRQELEDELSRMRHQVREQTGLVEVTPEAIRQMIAHLQEQREQMELDAAGAEGRRRAMTEAVAKLSAQLKERAQTDSVVEELKSVVEVRQKQLSRVRQLVEQGTTSASESDMAEANLAAARADLAAARQRVAGSAGADALDAWNRQIMELTVSAQEREARLQHVAKRLAVFSAALSNLDKLEQLRSQLQRQEQAVNVEQMELERAAELEDRKAKQRDEQKTFEDNVLQEKAKQ